MDSGDRTGFKAKRLGFLCMRYGGWRLAKIRTSQDYFFYKHCMARISINGLAMGERNDERMCKVWRYRNKIGDGQSTSSTCHGLTIGRWPD